MTQLDPLLPEAEVDPDDRPAIEWPTDPWDATGETGAVERLRRQTRPLKWVVYTLMVLILATILVAGAVGWWYLGRINPEGVAGDVQNFTVAETDDLDSMSQRLEDEGLVSDAGVFRWYVERNGGIEIVPGFYQLRPDDHMGNVLGRLRTPPGETYTTVTFPEGFTIERMGRRLGSTVERMNEDDFIAAANDPAVRTAWRPPGIATLEGMLFPDTYQVSNAESEEQVVERMISLMERVGNQEDIEVRASNFGRTPYEMLIIASIIEREAKVPEDRAKISRVIHNRLFVDMPLQVDASVLYGRDLAGIDPDTPFSELRQIDTPYNTYMHSGLPPTPIANPGRASIRAALNPAPNPPPGDPICVDLPEPSQCYYFFYVLADEAGTHAFAATFDQHDANVARARAAGLL
ncbi:MAG: endolytic transglycosylase MltG [Acidimicrobiia bacterium]|nr:endolytic transglycosylase MltG [Acidimicrobiia bacterium]